MAVSKSKLVNQARQADSYTENGALTNSTTLDSVLDLFFVAGSARALSDKQLEKMIISSYVQDKLTTLKLIFWAGDIRGGAGERRFFKVAMKWLYNNHKEDFYANLEQVQEFSRWDVLFDYADDTTVMNYIYKNFKEGNGLLAKWMPRKKQYNNFAQKFRTLFGLTPKQYRKSLVALTSVVETKMCAKEFGSINYEHVPSVAMKNYRTSFYKNDEKRFASYIDAVTKGEKKINASAIFPTDIVKKALNSGGGFYHGMNISKQEEDAIVAQWNALPNYLANSNETILPVCDCSESMSGAGVLHIAVALTLYVAERNNSIFKDAFMTFSERPEMNYFQGNIIDRIKQLRKSNWGYNTNVMSVFQQILNTAIKNNLSQEDMPSKVLMLSDMEFDNYSVAGNDADTINNEIKKLYQAKGYVAPQIVYWNISSRSTSNFPVSYNDNGVAMVSGQSPSIIKSVLSNELSPTAIMQKTLNTERYSVIKAGE